MTFLELCKLLRAEAGISGEGPASVVNQTGINLKIVNWIRRAYQEVQNIHYDWAFLWAESSFTLQAGKRDYAPRTDLALPDFNQWEAQSFYGQGQNSTTRAIVYIPFEEFRIRDRVERSGEPLSYTILPNDTLRFDSTPVQEELIRFEYYRAPFEMASNLDTPVWSSQFHDIILYKALMYYAADEEAPTIYQDAQINFNRRVTMFEWIERQQPFMTMQSLA